MQTYPLVSAAMRRTLSCTTIVLSLIAALTVQPRAQDAQDTAPDPIKTIVDRLNLDSYKATVKGLTQFGDRRQGTDRNRAAVDWIEAQLKSYGCPTERIDYDYQPPPPNQNAGRGGRGRGGLAQGGGRPRGLRIPTGVNTDPMKQPDEKVRALNTQPTTPGARQAVFCTKVGATHPEEMYIVSAHMDGHGWGEAANDDGSGTALVMELARVLSGADVRTERTVRFVLWNNEETGSQAARAYIAQRQERQGKEDPPGSGRYPEPKWLGLIQHDMMMFDHGMPLADGTIPKEQRPEADVNIEFQVNSKMAAESQALAWKVEAANEKYATDYPASVGSHMTNTDSGPFQDLIPAISLRENERGTQIGNGWDPQWHQPTDLFVTYSDKDFRLGLNAAQTTLGAVGTLTGATLKSSTQQQHEKLDAQTIGRIRDEGFARSQVMDHISWLSDVYGPRLTGSPAIQQASEWAMKKFNEWGLANVHQERWKFGKGWSLVRFNANLIEPQVQPIIGYPQSWTPGTKGTVTADVVRVQIASEADFAKYHGKLAGKIVLTQPARQVRMLEGPILLRMDEQWTAEALTTPAPAAGGGRSNQNDAAFRRKLQEFFAAEGVVATFDRGSNSDMSAGGSDLSWQQQRPDGGTIFPSGGGPRDETAGSGVPGVTLAVEHYNRMVRVLDKNVPVKVELSIEAKFYDEATMNGFNTIADLPGGDLASEVVLLGAHFDSHPYGTGATDNATGSAAMMEAMRILKAIGVKPRRTIRVGLWGGEEQGLLGSRAYVRDHLADVETMALKPEHAKLAAYFNSDNGTGRVRGVWLQSNLAAGPIFEQWMAPLKDLGVTILGPRSVTSTDHVSFDNAGIPAFQFLVDRLEYNARTHHSNMDTFDRVQRDDMIQQATVIAVFAYDAAMRDEQLPRKALPKPQRGRGESQ